MSSITALVGTDGITTANSMTKINTNFTNLNTDKIETSTLDTDTALTANSDAKIATQKAVKAYVDAGGNQNASTTQKGLVEEATLAEVQAGTATGGTGARLFINPSTTGGIINKTTTTTSSATPTINTDTYNRLVLSAQTTDITSMTTNLSGTPSDGDSLSVRITTIASSFSFINSASASGATATLAPSKPTNTADGDIMFAIARCYGGTITTLSGWTLVGNQSYALNGSNSALFYKVASSEGSSYTWTFSNTVLNSISLVTYRGGYNKSNPSPTFSNTAYTTNNPQLRATSISVPYNNSPLFFFGSNEDSLSLTPPTLPTTTTWAENLDNAKEFSVSTLYAAKADVAGGANVATVIDGTLSSSTTQKAAWLLALNPTTAITWGSKFTSSGNTLPTYLDSGEDYDFNFRYNSTLAKWEIIEPVRPTISMDSLAQDVSSTTTSTIPHYLGSKPKLVRISGSLGSGTTICTAQASYTTYQRSWYAQTDTGSGTGESYGPYFRLTTTVGSYLEGTITTDATNITITWAKTSTPTGTADLVWEAFI